MRVQLYHVHKASSRRGAKRNPTRSAQAKINEMNSRNRLSDLIHCNFTPDDLAVHLTYRGSEAFGDEKESKKKVYNYMRRLARLWGCKTMHPKNEFRWICVTEVSGTGRIHHHCIISGGLSIQEISDKWGHGHTSCKALEFDESGLAGLAAYITKSKTSYRRWSASNNLAKPIEKTRDYAVRKKDLLKIAETGDFSKIKALHPGYDVSGGSARVCDFDGEIYVAVCMYKVENRAFGFDKAGKIFQRRRTGGMKNDGG